MRGPEAPFLELNFYFAHREEQEVFLHLIQTLLELKGQFTGEAYVHSGPNINQAAFSWVYEKDIEAIEIKDFTILAKVIREPDLRLVKIYMNHIRGLIGDVAAVTYLSISPEAAQIDHHPLSIWTNGELFCGIYEYSQERERAIKEAGAGIYQIFRTLIKKLYPSYATITVEWGLECPTDLKQNPSSISFKDFFISGDYLGEEKLKKVQQLYSKAYIEPVENGLYISCYPNFNPIGHQISSTQADECSLEMSRMIAAIGE